MAQKPVKTTSCQKLLFFFNIFLRFKIVHHYSVTHIKIQARVILSIILLPFL